MGYPTLAGSLERAPYAALASHIQARVALRPIVERERFAQLISHGLKSAGCQHTLVSDAGLEIPRQASMGLPRQAGRILCTSRTDRQVRHIAGSRRPAVAREGTRLPRRQAADAALRP
ncbi:hypothetical protein [Pelomonas cellulosilytica]|uniref:Uncharacterized protein n=1 Tax=Pelomonas cellulosilytica TaxID=2906762 RepID=A0ABS8XU96_9BURK|nr:hypothetical protein [Pelomonas sp. P8]MCE4555307.1 hypothetical protein [Pelomonas sp. P8]